MVSIIIPNYNDLAFLPACLNSCLQQGEAVQEIIVVDDHSTDNSLEVLQSYQEQYPRKIRFFFNPGKGACAARNYGFEQSSGDFIQFLDADDILGDNKIATQLNVLKQGDPKSIASCQWQHFLRKPGDITAKHKQKVDRSYENPTDWLIDSWLGGGMGPVHNWLTPRTLIQAAGPWDENLLKNQDGEFFCRVLLQASQIEFVPDATVYYRKPSDNNLSRQTSHLAIKSLLESYKAYEKILAYREDQQTRRALAYNYVRFIVNSFPQFPELESQARKYIRDLGFEGIPVLSQRNRFNALHRAIGFELTLRLRHRLLRTGILKK